MGDKLKVTGTIDEAIVREIDRASKEHGESRSRVIETAYMARQYGLSPYDCAYMALAEKEKCDFLTGDKKLSNAIKNRLPWVKWIGDYISF